MIPSAPGAADVTDTGGLARLKSQARAESPEALKQTAQQFEALFLQMTMKNMRQAGEPFEAKLVGSNGERMFRDLQDQQMAQEMSKKSTFGFADMLVKQLGGPAAQADGKSVKGMGLDDYRHNTVRMIPLGDADGATRIERGGSAKPRFMPLTAVPAVSAPGAGHIAAARRAPAFADKQAFFQELLPEAESAARELGVDPKLLLSQAALETGWGRHMVRRGDGGDSHNLFGIKAGAAWDGRRVANNTLEYEQGVPVRKTDYFRAYDSYKESFHDYVDFLRANPRYTNALQQADDPRRYVAALQKAGYASDPQYANKVMAIYRRWQDFDPAAVDVAATAPEVPAAPAFDAAEASVQAAANPESV